MAVVMVVSGTVQHNWRFHTLGLLATLLVKGLVFVYFIIDFGGLAPGGHFAQWMDDSPGYVGPVDEFLEHGKVFDDHRMPGYAPPLLLFRLVLPRLAAHDAMALLQLVFGCLAAWACTVMVLWLTRSKLWTALAFVISCTAMFHSRYELQLMTDSLCASATTLAVFSVLAHLRSGRRAWLWVAGLMLTWAIFLRPIYALLFPCLGVLLLLRKGQSWRLRLGHVLLFVLPWLVIDGAWVVRNYNVYGEVRPLTNGLYNPTFLKGSYYAMLQFVTAYGGNNNYWDPQSDLRFYGLYEQRPPGMAPLPRVDKEPPDYIYTSEYNRDSLLLFRPLFEHRYDTAYPQVKQDSLRALVWERAMRYRAAFVEEHPFRYHVWSRVVLVGHLLNHSGSSLIFQKAWPEMAWWERGIKLYQSGLYVFAVAFGMIGGLVLLWFNRRDTAYLVLVGTVVYGVLIHSIAMRLCEMRYLVPTFPLTLTVAVLAAQALWARFRHRSRKQNARSV